MFLFNIGDYVRNDFEKVHTISVVEKQQYEPLGSDGGRRIGIDIVCVGDFPVLIRGNYLECTNALLDSFRTKSIKTDMASHISLPIACNRASNDIACKTKRGAGNTIFGTFSMIRGLVETNYMKQSYAFITATELNDDELVVAYRRPINSEISVSDCGLFIKKMGDNDYEIRTQERWLDYYHTVKIEYV